MGAHVVSRKNQIRSILFVVLLMSVTVMVILKDYSLPEILQAIKGTHPFYLTAGIIMMFVNISCQAMSLLIILQKLGHPVTPAYCMEYACVGTYFGGITPGAGGAQPAQMYYMSKDRIHIDFSAITVFYMVFINQLVILGLGGISALISRSTIAGLKNWLQYLLLAGCLALMGLTFLLIALMFMRKTIPFLFRTALGAGVRWRLVKNPETAAAWFDAAILSYREKSMFLRRHPCLTARILLLPVLQWVSYYMVAYLVYLSFGHNEYAARDLMAGQALMNMAVSAVPVPGSVGIAENAYLNMFGRFYSQEELPSAMILSRLINFYLPLFISFFVYLTVHFRAVRQKKPKQRNRAGRK